MADSSEDHPEHARLDTLVETHLGKLERRLDDHDRGGPGPKSSESGSIHAELDHQTITP